MVAGIARDASNEDMGFAMLKKRPGGPTGEVDDPTGPCSHLHDSGFESSERGQSHCHGRTTTLVNVRPHWVEIDITKEEHENKS